MEADDLIEEHVVAAQQAFWTVVADRFPEMYTGDLPPEHAVAFDAACRRVVWAWLDSNQQSTT